MGIELVGVVLTIRLALLSAERVFFHRLGQGVNPLITMTIAFGGAAGTLWLLALLSGQAQWADHTFWPALVYAGYFGCYTTSLVRGPISTVSPWTNAAVVMLFVIHPTGGLLAWLGLGLFGLGLVRFVWTVPGRGSVAVWWMLLANVFLVLGRNLDVNATHQPPLAYAATVFSGVTLWMLIGLAIAGYRARGWRIVVRRPQWAVLSAVTNAGAYVTLVLLLRQLPPAVVEAASSLAGWTGVLLGVYWLKESQERSKIVASALMTLGAVILFLQHIPGGLSP